MKKIITIIAFAAFLFSGSALIAQQSIYIDYPLATTPSGVEVTFGVNGGAPSDFYFELYRSNFDNSDTVFLATVLSQGPTVENYFYLDAGPFINATEYLYYIEFYTDTGILIGTAWSSATFYTDPYFINGKIAFDENANCLLENNETPLSNWTVVATDDNGNSYFANSATDGNFEIVAHEVGNFEVTAYPPNSYWEPCLNNLAIDGTTAWDTSEVIFAATPVIDCPALSVDIGTWQLRRCFTSAYIANYCNNGTAVAEDAQVKIVLDPLMSFAASPMPVVVVEDTLIFDLGDVEVGECNTIYFTVTLSCDAVLGATHCVTASITPDEICGSSSPLWDGSSIAVKSECKNDSIMFTIINEGDDMQQQRGYKVVEDNVMLMHGNFQLNADGMKEIIMPDNGTTLRLFAEQAEHHPTESHPTAHVESCGVTPFSLGFVNQFPEDDEAAVHSVFCIENVDSYDPNDKQGFPTGYDDQHYIDANRDIDYLIRFQNTGTAPAINVVIVDTLDQNFDLTKIQPGASSHPYRYQLYDEGIIAFEFENIMLPDSFSNEPESHGFVKFTIAQKADLPVGTVLENSAAIYFDFNEPVITNTTTHTIGEDFISVSIDQPIDNQLVTKVYPNPFSTSTTFEIESSENQNYSFQLFSLDGKMLREEFFQQHKFEFFRKNLPVGLFIFKIEAEGQLISSGKISIQ